jgi:hypothetical protein
VATCGHRLQLRLRLRYPRDRVTLTTCDADHDADRYTCSLTEAEAAGAASGTGLDSKIQQCMKECLADAVQDFDLAQFDSNKDGEIDAAGFLHSGYAAENGATDCFGAS